VFGENIYSALVIRMKMMMTRLMMLVAALDTGGAAGAGGAAVTGGAADKVNGSKSTTCKSDGLRQICHCHPGYEIKVGEDNCTGQWLLTYWSLVTAQ